MKKTKLKSRNPKYMKTKEQEQRFSRKLLCEVPTRNIKGKITSKSNHVKIYEIRYE